MTSSTKSTLSILLATGGPTLEAEGTSASTDALATYFRTTDHRVQVVDLAHPERFLATATGCELVFNAVHGRGGEDGGLHYLAELAGGVPVTGPRWWVHALGADKAGFKAWATRHVRVPRSHDDPAASLDHGLIRKPRFGGGSIGVELLGPDDLHGRSVGEDVVVEEFIPGRIVTCCVYPFLADSLPLLVITPPCAVYDEATKRGRADVSYSVVSPGSARWATETWEGSLDLYGLLGGRGPIRFDWIVEADTDDPVLLEVNTNPGWRPTGNMARIMAAAGLSYGDLVESVLVETVHLARFEGGASK